MHKFWFISRIYVLFVLKINWIPVMWPNHTMHQEISLDEANRTYDALQGIVEIGQKADQLVSRKN